jgi:hypothetical protein
MRIRSSILLLCGALLAGCNASQEPEQKTVVATPFSNQATMMQLMNWVFDTQADVVWAVGGTIITPEGETHIIPKNDDEWNAVRNAAVTVAEAGNLLMIEGRARDSGDWIKYARLMIDKANECVQAAEAKDVEAVFTAGSDLYLACTACHAQYVIGEPLKPEDMPK